MSHILLFDRQSFFKLSECFVQRVLGAIDLTASGAEHYEAFAPAPLIKHSFMSNLLLIEFVKDLDCQFLEIVDPIEHFNNRSDHIVVAQVIYGNLNKALSCLIRRLLRPKPSLIKIYSDINAISFVLRDSIFGSINMAQRGFQFFAHLRHYHGHGSCTAQLGDLVGIRLKLYRFFCLMSHQHNRCNDCCNRSHCLDPPSRFLRPIRRLHFVSHCQSTNDQKSSEDKTKN